MEAHPFVCPAWRCTYEWIKKIQTRRTQNLLTFLYNFYTTIYVIYVPQYVSINDTILDSLCVSNYVIMLGNLYVFICVTMCHSPFYYVRQFLFLHLCYCVPQFVSTYVTMSDNPCPSMRLSDNLYVSIYVTRLRQFMFHHPCYNVRPFMCLHLCYYSEWRHHDVLENQSVLHKRTSAQSIYSRVRLHVSTRC